MIVDFYMNGMIGINCCFLIKVFIKIFGMVCNKISYLLFFYINYF